MPEFLTPDLWMDQLLTSQTARQGGVVKRKVRDVERLVGRRAFAEEVARRGFQAVENREHFVIFCNLEPIRRLR